MAEEEDPDAVQGEEQEQEPGNPFKEKALEKLGQPPGRLDRRESSTKLEQQSNQFKKFRAGKEDPEPEEGEESPSKPPILEEEEEEDSPPRTHSARGFNATESARGLPSELLKAFKREIYGDSIDEEQEGTQGPGDQSAEEQQHTDQSDEQWEEGVSAEGQGGHESGDSGMEGIDGLEGWDEEGVSYDEDAAERTFQKVYAKTVVGGAVSTYKHKRELQEVLERRAALKFIRKRREDVQSRQMVLSEAEEKVSVVQGHVDEISSKLTQMREESQNLFQQDQFGNRDRIRALKAKISALEAKGHAELGALAKEQEIEYLARKEYNNAQIELRRVEELEAGLMEEEKQATEEAKIAADLRARAEEDAAKRFERRRQLKNRNAAEQRARDEEKTMKAADVAKAGRVAAIKRVKESRAKQMEAQSMFENDRSEERMKKAAALIELKKNQESAADKIKGANEKKRKKLRVIAQKHEVEKSEILAAGGNPYAEWRKRDQEAKRKKDEERRMQRMKEQENKLLKQIMEEEERRKVKEEHDRKHKALLKAFQKEMGGQAQQARVQEYMKERTVGGKDILDPTGREARIYPSKVTVLMDWKFGLGIPPKPAGAQPGEDVPPGHPRGYEKEDPAGVDGEGWRISQKTRLIDKMQSQNMGQTFNNSLVGSKYLDDSYKAPTEDRNRRKSTAIFAIQRTASDQMLMDSASPGPDFGYGDQLPEATIPKKDEEFAVPTFEGHWDEFENDRSVGGKKWTHLSKLEQQYMAEAMQRKKEGYGWIESQVVWGKEFKGTAFVPSEKGRDITAIEFKDFEPGKVYKRKVTLTNASYAFNTFKLMSLPDAVKDFFDISYTHPGALSPGMTCDLHIKFEPKINEDLDEYIPLLCQTGPQNIPLRCYTKKVLVSTSTPEVDLDVILGESLTKNIVLVNKGALNAPFTIKQMKAPPRPDHLDEDLAEAEANGLYVDEPEITLTHPDSAVAQGYSTTKVEVTFIPKVTGQMLIPLHLCFKKEMSQPQSPDICINVIATAHDVPIYVEEEITDLRCCVFDQTYSQIIPVRNRGKVALKVMPTVPTQLKGLVKFAPDMAYVQARDRNGESGRFEFQMKFEPEKKLLQRCKEFLVEGPTGELDTLMIPMRIAVPDQTLPLYFTLRAQLTEAEIVLDKTKIDFGECTVADSVMVRVNVTNRSTLPTRMGFLQLPRGVTIRPPLGLASMLPNETKTLEIAFSPYTDTEFNFKTTLTTSSNRKYVIPCKAVGIAPPLNFTCTAFTLAACAPGDRVTTSFFCTNVGKDDKSLEVLVPKTSGLKLSPLVATLAPQQTIRFQLDFCPTDKPDGLLDGFGRIKSAEPAENSAEGEEEAAEEGEPAEGGEEEDGEEGEEADQKPEGGMTDEEKAIHESLHVAQSKSDEEGEPWSRHHTWQMPVFIQNGPVMYLEAQTTTVMPIIIGRLNGKVMVPEVNDEGVETLPILDFGKLPLGQEKVLSITLTNVSEIETDISHRVLDPFGAFTILKSPTRLTPGLSQTVNVAFRPKKEAAFKEKLTILSEANSFRCCMVGHGVSPLFQMEGLNIEQGRIDVGDVYAGQQIDIPFELINNSPFEVTYTIEFTNLGETNSGGLIPFDCVPAEATIAAEDKKTVTLTFSPDVASLYFAAIIKIIVPNQKEKMEWRVVGRSWRQAMVLYDSSPEAHSAPLDVNRFKDQVEEEEGQSTIHLERTFPQAVAQAKEESEHELMIANCGAKGPGDLTFENLKEAEELGFTLDPPGGKVDAGAKTPMMVKYTPPEGGPLSMWNEIILRGALKGGDPAPAGGAVLVEIRLRGFVPASLQ